MYHVNYFCHYKFNKLDRVGPVDNRPSADQLYHFDYCKRKYVVMWQLPHDRWQVTCDRRHMTCDTWHMTHDTYCGINILSKFQLSGSSGLGLIWSEGSLNESVIELMKDGGDCRRAPATPGLFNMKIYGHFLFFLYYNWLNQIVYLTGYNFFSKKAFYIFIIKH